MIIYRILLVAVLLLCLISGLTLAQSVQYHNHLEMSANLEQLADDHSKLIKLDSHGKTLGKKDIWSVTLTSGKADSKPAVLLVAGVHGPDLAGTEVLLQFIQSTAQNYGKVDSITQMLDRTTFYIFPRVNPDASESLFSTPRYDRSLNNRPMDLDRDGKVDEDGFDDLNKDGEITWMRITEAGGEWFADENYPDLLQKANTGKGETGVFRLIREGYDNDGDGELNEDEPGGVNFNQNFTFKYEFFSKGAGFHQISEIETRILTDFAFAHPNIAAVFSFSPNDNLNHPWEIKKGPGQKPSGRRNRQPVGHVEKDDVSYYAHISDKFKELTGMNDLPKSESGQGAFNEWAYFHFGRWSFSTPTWWPPMKTSTSDSSSKTNSTSVEKVKKPEGSRSARSGKGPEKSNKQRLWDWFQFTGQQDAFFAWKEIKHPDFPDNKVEIGGFKPMSANNPPADSLAAISQKYYDFLVRLSGWLPRIEIQNMKVTHLHDNVYRLSLNVVNFGYLPTNTNLGIRNKWSPKIKLSLELANKQSLVSGRVLSFIDLVDGSGGSKEASWVVMGKKGDSVKISIGSPMVGTLVKNVKLQ